MVTKDKKRSTTTFYNDKEAKPTIPPSPRLPSSNAHKFTTAADILLREFQLAATATDLVLSSQASEKSNVWRGDCFQHILDIVAFV